MVLAAVAVEDNRVAVEDNRVAVAVRVAVDPVQAVNQAVVNQAVEVHRAAVELVAVHPLAADHPVAAVADHLAAVLRLVAHPVAAAVGNRVVVVNSLVVDNPVVDNRVGDQMHRVLPLPQLHFHLVFTALVHPLKST